MKLSPEAVKVGLEKIEKGEELLRSLDDFATELLGKTAEALDLIETGHGLLTGKLILKDGLPSESDPD